MADTVEMQDIRGLDVDKAVKGFALASYTFKDECEVVNTKADHVRWYQETAADLTATAPAAIGNISPLSTFATLEHSWTRDTDYIQKYGVESFISMEDMESADIDVLARTLLRLTRAVQKKVDTDIYNAIIGDANIQGFSGSAMWSGSGGTVLYDILDAKRRIYDYHYSPQGATLIIEQRAERDIVDWLVSHKGSNIPQFASEQIQKGTVMNIAGINIKTSPNANVRLAVMMVPKRSVTWRQHTPITSRVIQEPGIGSKIRVWELGVTTVTDPKAVCVISGINANS